MDEYVAFNFPADDASSLQAPIMKMPFWNGTSMTFGDNQKYLLPLVDINVSAHYEVNHGFTEQNSVWCTNISGGMNEAFSRHCGRSGRILLRGNVDWVVRQCIIQIRRWRYFDQPSKRWPLD
ncbi:hypothetical protein O9993_18695 [Vibrio lentus]|nr:hypothetical protein [Vibrio lentus]